MIRKFFKKIFSREVSENGKEKKDLKSFKDVENELEAFESNIEDLKEEIYEIKRFTKEKCGRNSKSIENMNETLENFYLLIEEFLAKENNFKTSNELDSLKDRINDIENKFDKLFEDYRVNDVKLNYNKKGFNQSFSRPKTMDQRDRSIKNKAEGVVDGEILWKNTTPAQKNVLKVLYESGYPMSYKELGDELNRSISTVKNHINTLKSMGVNFVEERQGNSSKKYMLDERIKSFLTMRLND